MWFSKNIRYKNAKPISSWRKISIGSWRPTGDSSIHSMLELNVEPLKVFLSEFNADNNCQCNVLQYFSWVMAQTISQYPYINQSVRFGRLYKREDIDIFLHVAIDKKDGEDLSGITIRKANELSLLEFCKESQRKIKALSEEGDLEYKEIKKIFKFLPGMFSRPFLNISNFIMYKLNIWSPFFKSPKDAFGSIQVTNIGSFDIDNAFVPIAPYTNIPMVISLGSIKKRAFVLNDEVKAVETVKACFTCDHRIMEGVHFGKMQKVIIKMMEQPMIQNL